MRKNPSYTPLLRHTRLSIYGIFPSKPGFHLHKWKKSFLHTLTFIYFWEIYHLHNYIVLHEYLAGERIQVGLIKDLHGLVQWNLVVVNWDLSPNLFTNSETLMFCLAYKNYSLCLTLTRQVVHLVWSSAVCSEGCTYELNSKLTIPTCP